VNEGRNYTNIGGAVKINESFVTDLPEQLDRVADAKRPDLLGELVAQRPFASDQEPRTLRNLRY
jgi:hypothetical protein